MAIYGLEVDMWGVGLLVFVLLHGHNPFERDTEIETLQAILLAQYQIPESLGVSALSDDLVCRLLVCDPAMRCKASEALRHEWLARPGLSAANVCDSIRAIRRPCATVGKRGLSRPRASSEVGCSWSSQPYAMADHLSLCRARAAREIRYFSFDGSDHPAALAAR